MCSCVAGHGPLTDGGGLQHERDNAEEVDVGIVNSELHKDGLGVHVKPGVVIKVLEGSTKTRAGLNDGGR